MVTSKNISLADVMTEEVTKEIVVQRVQVSASRARFRSNTFGQVDPRGELKSRKKKMPVATMVPYEDIPLFTKMAEEVMQAYRKS